MTTLVLENLSSVEAMAVADNLLRLGKASHAAAIYRALINKHGGKVAPAIYARLGLAERFSGRSAVNLEVLRSAQELDKAGAFVSDGLATWLKATPFLEDPRFIAIADKHSHLLPLANWHWNLQTVLWAVQQTQAIAGDMVELGVFKGHTTLFVADYVGFAAWDKQWFLYDTFEGIPEDQLDPGWAQSNASLYQGTFSFEDVRDRFAAYPNIKVTKGRVPEILAAGAPERISFMHMDLNNATAEIQALDVLFDRITPGGMIVFDDYGWTVSQRQRHAEDAWMAKRGYRILPLPTGQGLFVKR